MDDRHLPSSHNTLMWQSQMTGKTGKKCGGWSYRAEAKTKQTDAFKPGAQPSTCRLKRMLPPALKAHEPNLPGEMQNYGVMGTLRHRSSARCIGRFT